MHATPHTVVLRLDPIKYTYKYIVYELIRSYKEIT